MNREQRWLVALIAPGAPRRYKAGDGSLTDDRALAVSYAPQDREQIILPAGYEWVRA